QFRLQPVEIKGEKFQQILALPGATRLNIPGAPQLPVFSALVGIPPSGNPQIRVLESKFNEIPEVDLIPAPELEFEPSAEGGYFKPTDPIRGEVYQQENFFPAAPAEIISIETIRGLRSAKVLIYPFQYNPAQRLLCHFTALKIALSFNAQTPAISPITPHVKDPFERVLEKSIINYPVAKNWRQPAPTLEKVRVQPDWYHPENPHYKLLVSSDGLYRLTHSDLLNHGVDLSGVDPLTIKIFNKGEQVPIRVSGEGDAKFDEGDYLEFYGRRNYGDTEFYDDYSDTNVYWLSYNGSPGKRFVEKQSLAGDFDELITHRRKLHFERDLSYYQGDGRSVLQTPTMPGEGWVWKEFFVNDQLQFSFILTDVDLQSAELCTLSARLRGITLDPVSPDHVASLVINGNEVGRAAFDDRQEVFPAFWFSPSLLKNGINQLKIKSEETGAELNKFYLDWIKLSFPASFDLANDHTEFEAPEDGEARLSLWNLPPDSFCVYNLTRGYYVSDALQKPAQRYIFKLLSAGFEDGNFCQIRVNNTNLINGGRRGHNIAVFDTSTGMADGVFFFDTHGSLENADSMATFISTIPEGKLVLVGVRDEGSYRMTEAAHQALESVGSALTRQVGFRDAYVLLGRKGAPPGTVPELLLSRGQGAAVLTDTLLTFNPNSVHLMFQDHFIRGDYWLIAAADSVKKPDRIVRHQYQGLADVNNGADYIFIYHPKFLGTAERFSQFWTQKNYRTKIVNI
ncbi:MAG: interleukin-like EMT inducer domain-containing protein, partial [bacterium]|nr:interleukin-like EMT inducer domain-containing protein [bacterium]